MKGEMIRKIREEIGFTQEEMAADLGVSRSLIALIEQGRRDCSERLEKRIRRAYAEEIAAIREREGKRRRR
jgi:transcriptional regulator with XRE-family HTH domain